MADINNQVDEASSYRQLIAGKSGSLNQSGRTVTIKETNIKGEDNIRDLAITLDAVAFSLTRISNQSADQITEISEHLQSIDQGMMR